jgi:hypothetical protein
MSVLDAVRNLPPWLIADGLGISNLMTGRNKSECHPFGEMASAWDFKS